MKKVALLLLTVLTLSCSVDSQPIKTVKFLQKYNGKSPSFKASKYTTIWLNVSNNPTAKINTTSFITGTDPIVECLDGDVEVLEQTENTIKFKVYYSTVKFDYEARYEMIVKNTSDYTDGLKGDVIALDESLTVLRIDNLKPCEL